MITGPEELSTIMYPAKRAVIVLAVASACGSGPVSHYEPGEPIATPEPAVDARAKAPPEPVRVPGVKSRAAQWWEDPAPKATVDDPLKPRTVVSVGARNAIVRAGGFLVAVSEDRGVSGLVAAESLGARLMADGSVLIASGNQLMRAPRAAGLTTPSARVPLKAAPRLKVISAWDAAGKTVAMADGAWVHVSTNTGKRFGKIRVPGRANTVEQLAVRPDGMIVALTSAGPYTSRRGSRFVRSRFRIKKLARRGSWVHDDEGPCSAVLAADGRRWLMLDPAKAFAKFRSWTELTELTDGTIGHDKLLLESATVPPAPRTAKKVLRGTKKACAWGRGRGGSLGARDYAPEAPPPGLLGSLRGTVGPVPLPTASAVRFFNDAKCTPGPTGCDYAKPPLRVPHLLWFKQVAGAGPTRLLSLPKRCTQPSSIDMVHGLGLLRCVEGGVTEMHSVHELPPDSNGHIADPAFRPDGTIPFEAARLVGYGVAPDGTVVVSAACKSGDCLGWVRPPTGGWKALTTKGAVAFRALRGGRALGLVATAETETNATVRVVLLGQGTRQVLVDKVELNRRVTGFELDRGRRVVLRLARSDGSTEAAWLGTKGELIPVMKGAQ